ncbi:MAG TPA: hypothetical protein VH413_11350 [Verrucomicrobiae bacterium]|nr:hypothetical protein [Verrucomicrobiae bacterium]
MSTTVQSWRPAWEPLTPRGVAAFAGASFGRLFLAQLLVAMLAAAAVAGFLRHAWFPVVRDAVHVLPAQGKIADQKLDWRGNNPQQLAQNRFLGIGVDLHHSGQLGREAHLQIEFGGEDVRVYSLLGYEVIEYLPDWAMPFNQTVLEPRWGAWEPFILVGAATLTVVTLFVSWSLLATLYWLPVKLITFFENRDLSWTQSWRLASASMMPGALFLTAGIVAYTFNVMDLIRFGAVYGLHFVVSWIYLIVAPLFCPRATETKTLANPFTGSTQTAPTPATDKSPDKN